MRSRYLANKRVLAFAPLKRARRIVRILADGRAELFFFCKIRFVLIMVNDVPLLVDRDGTSVANTSVSTELKITSSVFSETREVDEFDTILDILFFSRRTLTPIEDRPTHRCRRSVSRLCNAR